MGLVIKNVAMDGTEKSYTVPNNSPPNNILSVAFQARTTDISMYTTASGSSTAWTLVAGGPGVVLNGRDLAGSTIYFTAPSGTLQIMEQTGLGQ